MSLSRRFGLFTLAATVTFSTAVFAPTFINILTGGTSGVYYPIGSASRRSTGTISRARKPRCRPPRPRSRTLNLLQAGRGELALALGDSVADAWNGVADAGFKAPLKSCGLSAIPIRTISR